MNFFDIIDTKTEISKSVLRKIVAKIANDKHKLPTKDYILDCKITLREVRICREEGLVICLINNSNSIAYFFDLKGNYILSTLI